jgi:rhomboid protease GluP
MGLVGALFVIVTLDWFSQKSKLTTRRFLSVIFIIVLQSIFDYFIPEISGLSHILGLAIGGFVCVVLLALSRK